MMVADAFTAIGRGHLVCEDYARAGVSEQGELYAVLSDGCSGSPDTDFGARFLVRAAEDGLRRGEGFDAERAVRRAAGMAALAFEGAADVSHRLDATLLGIRAGERDVSVSVQGDGVVCARRRDGTVELVTIEYARGAPAYASYLLDPARARAYLAQSDGARRSVTFDRPGRAPESEERTGFGPDELGFERHAFDLVAVLSDGAAAFRCSATNARVPVRDVVEALAAVPVPRGRFLVRRARRFLARTCSARGWYPSDDLAIAGVWLGAAR